MAKNLANTIKPAYTHWKPLSDEEFELSMNDFVSFCENSIVLDKNGAPVKFTLNEAQELFASHFLEAIKPILAKTPTPSVKVCCHKSRQMGITTVCLKLEQYVMSKATNMNAIHIMPTEDEANEMIDRKLTPLLQATHPELMATMVAADKHVDFKDLEGVMLDNRLTFMSSGTQGAGHGRTIHMAIFDEYAKYLDPFTLEAGILPAMSGNTIRVVLFTAKGMNHAYDLAEVAKDEESDWIYMFLPWYIMSEYEMEPEGRYKTLEGLTDYDVFLFEEFKRAGVPPSKWARKAMWYNYTFINEAKRDTKYMYENYPTIAEESFRASGSPIFDAHKLAEWSSREFKRLDMFSDGDGTEFRYTEEGILREYEPPKRGASYILGADPADGDVAGDDSALVVWRVADEKITAVASYNGTVTQTDFAELVFDVATRYNDALVVPERNVGQLMIKWLVDIKGYANIWTDAKKVSGYNNLGVYTTQAVKNEMISRLKFLINNGYYEDFDPVFCEQAKYFTYQKTPSGQMKAAAAAGKHDDMVLSRLLAVMSLDMDQFGDYNHQIVREGKKYG